MNDVMQNEMIEAGDLDLEEGVLILTGPLRAKTIWQG